MSSEDAHLRTRARRRRCPLAPDREYEPGPKPGLVSQGVRSQGRPWIPQKTPDDFIREFRRGEPGRVWTRLF